MNSSSSSRCGWATSCRFYPKLMRIGRTSITVKVEVYAERFGSQGQYIKVTEASLTYVAIDEAGQPREVPRP